MGESSQLAAGMQAERESRFSEAERIYRSITAEDVDYPAALLRLGVLAARDGRRDLSRRTFETLLSVKPNAYEAMEWLASFLRQDGFLHEAMAYYQRAIELEPRNLRLWFGLAECQLELWNNVDAIQNLTRLSEVSSDFAPVYERLGVAYWREGQTEEAIGAFRKAIELAPTFSHPYANLAQLLKREGRHEEAAEVLRQATEAAGTAVDKLLEFAAQYMAGNDAPEAERAARLALRAAPNNEVVEHFLVRILQKQGRFKESEELLSELLQRHPGYLPPYVDFVRARRMTNEDLPRLATMQQWTRRPEVQLVDKQNLFYALGKAYDDLGEYGRALSFYREANGIAEMRLPNQRVDRAMAADTTTRVIETFSKATLEKLAGHGSQSETPIFIAGMIRSGTTLTEQVISSHPMVGAAGEIRYLTDHSSELLVPDLASNTPKFKEFAERYLRRLRFEAGDHPRITDKMPDNIMVLGLVHLLFPEARLILCRRNPFDNCLSAYVTPHDVPQAFLYSAENLAFLYQEHARLTQHWESVLPADRFMVLDYEELALTPEPVIRKLIEFLGLPWDDACLAHQSNSRVIHTPSLWQVRQQMYTSSVNRWKNYEPWIEELKAALGA